MPVFNFFGPNTPVVEDAKDPAGATTAGVVFRNDYIWGTYLTKIRFYKPAGSTVSGPRKFYIWAKDDLVYEGVFHEETASGWQEQGIYPPLLVRRSYYHTAAVEFPDGRYPYTDGVFAASQLGQPAPDGNIYHSMPASTTIAFFGYANGQGVYRYGLGPQRPMLSTNLRSYFVDVELAVRGYLERSFWPDEDEEYEFDRPSEWGQSGNSIELVGGGGWSSEAHAGGGGGFSGRYDTPMPYGKFKIQHNATTRELKLISFNEDDEEILAMATGADGRIGGQGFYGDINSPGGNGGLGPRAGGGGAGGKKGKGGNGGVMSPDGIGGGGGGGASGGDDGEDGTSLAGGHGGASGFSPGGAGADAESLWAEDGGWEWPSGAGGGWGGEDEAPDGGNGGEYFVFLDEDNPAYPDLCEEYGYLSIGGGAGGGIYAGYAYGKGGGHGSGATDEYSEPEGSEAGGVITWSPRLQTQTTAPGLSLQSGTVQAIIAGPTRVQCSGNTLGVSSGVPSHRTEAFFAVEGSSVDIAAGTARSSVSTLPVINGNAAAFSQGSVAVSIRMRQPAIGTGLGTASGTLRADPATTVRPVGSDMATAAGAAWTNVEKVFLSGDDLGFESGDAIGSISIRPAVTGGQLGLAGNTAVIRMAVDQRVVGEAIAVATSGVRTNENLYLAVTGNEISSGGGKPTMWEVIKPDGAPAWTPVRT